MKNNVILGFIGTIGSLIATAYGGWDMSLNTLIIFMAIDYITGIIVAGVFKNSKKTDTGGLQSKAGYKGLCRKGGILLVVLVSCRLDIMLGTTFVRDAVVIAYIINETLSIIENVGLMGVPIPQVLVDAIDILKKKEKKVDE